MPDEMTRASRRASQMSEIDPTLSTAIDELLASTPETQHDQVRGAVGAFVAWIERTGKEFPGYDEAFEAYAAAMDGTSGAGTLPYVQLLLVTLGVRSAKDNRGKKAKRGAHAAA